MPKGEIEPLSSCTEAQCFNYSATSASILLLSRCQVVLSDDSRMHRVTLHVHPRACYRKGTCTHIPVFVWPQMLELKRRITLSWQYTSSHHSSLDKCHLHHCDIIPLMSHSVYLHFGIACVCWSPYI